MKKDIELKECPFSTCENWSTGNNCQRCEDECKHFKHGGCKLELEKCYKVDNCYFKQNKILKEYLLDVYNYKMSKRDINKHIEKCFGEIQELQKLVKKKLRIVK